MKTAWSTLPADSAMVMDTQKKTEPGELDACFSEASAGSGLWGSSYSKTFPCRPEEGDFPREGESHREKGTVTFSLAFE